MISINVLCQLVAAVSMSSSGNKLSQSVSSNIWHAIPKSAFLYLQMVLGRCCTCLPLSFHLSESWSPLWSEFAIGGIVEHWWSRALLDTRARSISGCCVSAHIYTGHVAVSMHTFRQDRLLSCMHKLNRILISIHAAALHHLSSLCSCAIPHSGERLGFLAGTTRYMAARACHNRIHCGGSHMIPMGVATYLQSSINALSGLREELACSTMNGYRICAFVVAVFLLMVGTSKGMVSNAYLVLTPVFFSATISVIIMAVLFLIDIQLFTEGSAPLPCPFVNHWEKLQCFIAA